MRVPSFDPPSHPHSRPLGLRFVIDFVNAPDHASSWSPLSAEHGDANLGRARVSPDALSRSVASIREILGLRDTREAAGALNTLLISQPSHTELVELTDGRWALRPVISEGTDAAAAFTSIATFALATWLAERGRCAWGLCAAAGCGIAFVDEGRRAPQRFCSSTCATRTRVAAHRRSAGATKS